LFQIVLFRKSSPTFQQGGCLKKVCQKSDVSKSAAGNRQETGGGIIPALRRSSQKPIAFKKGTERRRSQNRPQRETSPFF